MTFRLLASVVPVLLLAQETTPTFRADVRFVNVIATVKNQAGNLVGDLHKEDFEVRDNGVLQEIKYFGRQTDQPLSVALLIDTSGSTAKDLGYETNAAAKFLRALLAEGNPADGVALYSFNYDVEEGAFTRNYNALERRLKTLKGETGTSLYDAIFFASRALEGREGRKTIVIMTDGGDTTSSRDLKTALKAAQMADAVVYPIVVLPITNPAGRNIGGENALQFIAEGTGGRTFYPALNEQLDKAFADVIRELRTQYVLGFYPSGVPPAKDPFHKLEVRVKSPELRVSARNGYYGEAEGGSSGPSRISVSPERPKRPDPPKKK